MKKNYFIFASSFLFNVGMNILNFSLVYRLVDWFGFNPGQIGSFIGLGMLFFFLGCNLYHRFGSAFDPAKIFPVSVALVFLASIPLGFAPGLLLWPG
jgi:MFS family permease